MKTTFYQIDAFTEKVFGGNPAAVCPLQDWLPDDILQNIAQENNLAETAFYVKKDRGYEIRWFTPVCEVDLCGHATIASGHALFNHEGYSGTTIEFSSRSGILRVTKKEKMLALDFPVDTFESIDPPKDFIKALGASPIEAYRGKTDFMFVYKSQQEIQNMEPDLDMLKKVHCRGLIVTAKGDFVDFVSRFFAPQVGIPEDPVTGSAHTTLTPYWSKSLKKSELTALQLSKRGGALYCRLIGSRVEIAGYAKTYLIGQIEI